MNLHVSQFHGWRVIAIDGEFASRHLEKVEQCLQELEQGEQWQIAFDLSKTTHFDSRAVTLMLNLYKKITDKKGGMAVINPRADILGILSIVGLNTLVSIYDTRSQFEEAIKE
jgi:anti-anti-sigma factor